MLRKLTNVFTIDEDSYISTDVVFIVGEKKYALSLGKNIAHQELERMESELNYKLGFAENIKKKLSNEKFINKAPTHIIEVEKKKLSDAEIAIQSIKESIERLKLIL